MYLLLWELHVWNAEKNSDPVYSQALSLLKYFQFFCTVSLPSALSLGSLVSLSFYAWNFHFFFPFCHYITELGKYRALLCVQSACAGSVTQIPSKDNIIKFITALCDCTWHAAQAVEIWNLKDAEAKPLKSAGLWGTGWQLLPDISGSCNYHTVVGNLHGTGRTGSREALLFSSKALLPPDIQVKVGENWTVNRYCRQ